MFDVNILKYSLFLSCSFMIACLSNVAAKGLFNKHIESKYIKVLICPSTFNDKLNVIGLNLFTIDTRNVFIAYSGFPLVGSFPLSLYICPSTIVGGLKQR